MPIRWDTEPVRAALERVAASIKDAKPLLLKAIAEAENATSLPNLPLYMSESLNHLPRHAKVFPKSCEQDIRLARERIPDSPVARTKPQSGPRLF